MSDSQNVNKTCKMEHVTISMGCIVCGKEKTAMRKIDSEHGVKRNIIGLFQTYSGICIRKATNMTKGRICRSCLKRLENLHNNASQFRNTCKDTNLRMSKCQKVVEQYMENQKDVLELKELDIEVHATDLQNFEEKEKVLDDHMKTALKNMSMEVLQLKSDLQCLREQHKTNIRVVKETFMDSIIKLQRKYLTLPETPESKDTIIIEDTDINDSDWLKLPGDETSPSDHDDFSFKPKIEDLSFDHLYSRETTIPINNNQGNHSITTGTESESEETGNQYGDLMTGMKTVASSKITEKQKVEENVVFERNSTSKPIKYWSEGSAFELTVTTKEKTQKNKKDKTEKGISNLRKSISESDNDEQIEKTNAMVERKNRMSDTEIPKGDPLERSKANGRKERYLELESTDKNSEETNESNYRTILVQNDYQAENNKTNKVNLNRQGSVLPKVTPSRPLVQDFSLNQNQQASTIQKGNVQMSPNLSLLKIRPAAKGAKEVPVGPKVPLIVQVNGEKFFLLVNPNEKIDENVIKKLMEMSPQKTRGATSSTNSCNVTKADQSGNKVSGAIQGVTGRNNSDVQLEQGHKKSESNHENNERQVGQLQDRKNRIEVSESSKTTEKRGTVSANEIGSASKKPRLDPVFKEALTVSKTDNGTSAISSETQQQQYPSSEISNAYDIESLVEEKLSPRLSPTIQNNIKSMLSKKRPILPKHTLPQILKPEEREKKQIQGGKAETSEEAESKNVEIENLMSLENKESGKFSTYKILSSESNKVSSNSSTPEMVNTCAEVDESLEIENFSEEKRINKPSSVLRTELESFKDKTLTGQDQLYKTIKTEPIESPNDETASSTCTSKSKTFTGLSEAAKSVSSQGTLSEKPKAGPSSGTSSERLKSVPSLAPLLSKPSEIGSYNLPIIPKVCDKLDKKVLLVTIGDKPYYVIVDKVSPTDSSMVSESSKASNDNNVASNMEKLVEISATQPLSVMSNVSPNLFVPNLLAPKVENQSSQTESQSTKKEEENNTFSARFKVKLKSLSKFQQIKPNPNQGIDVSELPDCDSDGMLDEQYKKEKLEKEREEELELMRKKQSATVPNQSKLCYVCGKFYENRGTLYVHLKEHFFRPYVCQHCGKSFKREAHLKEHSTMHTKDWHVCHICGKNIKYSNSFKKHMKIHRNEKTVICSICGAKYNENRSLKKHMLNVHELNKKQRRYTYHCRDCDTDFPDKGTYKQHREEDHMDNCLRCSQCGILHPNVESLEKHALIHDQPLMFSCINCEKYFSEAKHIEYHMNIIKNSRHHQPKCNQCNLTFSNRKCFHQHVNDVVHEDHIFRCLDCGMVCQDQRALEEHLQEHFRKDLLFGCGLCPKSFSIMEHLKFHMARHSREEGEYELDFPRVLEAIASE